MFSAGTKLAPAQSPAEPAGVFASGEGRTTILCLLLVVVTLAFYSPITHNGFIDFDDSAYLLQNPQVRAGLTWNTVKWSFTTFHAGNWHPLTWLSHALDCQIFGLNPVGHHYTNVLLHAANAVLLFWLLLEATGFVWPSVLVAALFALHPVNVESVAWAAERKNVLSTLFFLLALHAYGRYARTGRFYLYGSVVVLFALGLMAKPQIITLPCVLLLWDYWPLRRMWAGPPGEGRGDAPPRSFSFLVLEKIPLFVLSLLDSVITVQAQRSGNTVRTFSEMSVSARLENAVVSYVRYLADALWPSRLAPMYPHPGSSLPAWQVAGPVALLLLLTVVVVRWRNRRYLLVGWFWFLGTLIPMLGIVQVGEQAMADRYAYIPLIGVFVGLVWSVSELSSERKISRAGLTVSAALVLFTLGGLTYRQLGNWHDDETLWKYTLGVTRRNYMAHNNLALAFAKQGRVDEAIVQFRAAEAFHKYPPDQILKLGFYELNNGRAQEAVEESAMALRASTDPQLQAAAWSQLGFAHALLHHYDQARESYQNALRLNPDHAPALIGMGVLAQRQGESDLAVSQFSRAVKVQPSDVNFLLLAGALRQAGRPSEAENARAQAQKISPDLSQAQSTTAQLLSSLGAKPD